MGRQIRHHDQRHADQRLRRIDQPVHRRQVRRRDRHQHGRADHSRPPAASTPPPSSWATSPTATTASCSRTARRSPTSRAARSTSSSCRCRTICWRAALATVKLSEKDIKTVNTSDADIVAAFKSPELDGGGDLESAADGGEGRAGRDRGVRLRARSPARSRTCWWSTPQTLKDNPDLGKALVGIWYETIALMKDRQRQGQGRARGDGQALRHRPRRLRGAAQDDAHVLHAGRRARLHDQPRPAEDHGPRPHLLLRAQSARRERQVARTPSASKSPPARRSATKNNVKLRFDATSCRWPPTASC